MKASGQSLGVTCRGGEKGVSLILSRQESIHFPSLAQMRPPSLMGLPPVLSLGY